MEDSRYPSPSLYDLVLLLGAEPGLEAWWNTVATIMRDWYGAERATLSVPADASDIENVPWGQKAALNLAGLNETQQHAPNEPGKSRMQHVETNEQTAAEPENEVFPFTTLSPAKRPKLESRHSFAGHERQGATPPLRPRGPVRTVSHAPQTAPRGEHPLRQVAPVSFDGAPYFQDNPSHEHSFSDSEFSSVGDGHTRPYAVLFPVLRALDHEPDPLIDNAGISRVLERGRVVTLTRDYASSLGTSRRNSNEPGAEWHMGKPNVKSALSTSAETQKAGGIRSRSGNAPRHPSFDLGDSNLKSHYEEYEQFPSSPWAQSPAPSPAIQSDPSDNPFFPPSGVDEDTFNPSGTSPNYSRFGPVEAIGVDKASTVIHIPLLHPLLSKPMQPVDVTSTFQTPTMSRRSTSESKYLSEEKDSQRRAPIAVLSILSSTVPYPNNLSKSLKLLGPHLATSYSNAYQYTCCHNQATSIRYRRYISRHQIGFAPISGPESLDDLLRLDMDEVGDSTTGSVTSPSDYSGRSRQSPGGSAGGTPGWDPSAMGFSSKHSIGGMPGHLSGTEAVESYFDAKKRSNLVAPGKPSGSGQGHIAKKPSIAIAAEDKQDEVPVSSRTESRPKLGPTVTDDTQEQGSAQPSSPRKLRMVPPPAVLDRRPHSMLHSYGADFSSSFQSLPAPTTPGHRTPGQPRSAARRGSYAEIPELLPPSERLLRTIVDALPVQIFTAEPNTGILTWANSKFLSFRNGNAERTLLEPWQLVHPEDQASYDENWNRCLRTGQQLQLKVRLLRFDGTYRWSLCRAVPLLNTSHQIVHWIGTNMDCHDQHIAETNFARQQEIAASEAKYRTLANSSPQIVFVASKERGIIFCNSQWELYSGQTESQALNVGFMEYIHPDDLAKCKLPEINADDSTPTNVPTSVPVEHTRQSSTSTDNSSSENSSETERNVTSPSDSSPISVEMPKTRLSKLASEGVLKVTKDADGRPSYATEVRLRAKDGEYYWHLVRGLLADTDLSGNNEEETWFGTCTDIHEHKVIEQSLQENMDQKSRFLSNMSHEIRTPLNGISGMVNFLLDTDLTSEQMEHINIIRNSTDGLRNLINDILDLSKVEAGMITLNLAWFHLPSLIEEVNDLTSALAIGKGLELNYLVEEGVPSMVKGDSFRIRQVLLNVIGNAIKFTQTGEVFVRCQLSSGEDATLKENETMILFEVIDTGSGFSEKEAEILFKRFSQIDGSSTRQHGGTGLGLAISRSLVELHGGIMKANSVVGEGSNFKFTIKFALPSEDDHPPSRPATTPGPFLHSETTPAPLDFPEVTEEHGKVISTDSSNQSESVKSPAPSLPSSERSRESSSLSSGSSDPSIYTGQTSIHSERSSASSFLSDPSLSKDPGVQLSLPAEQSVSQSNRGESDESLDTNVSSRTIQPAPINRSSSPLGSALQPPMYSILLVCPLNHSREAAVKHIEMTLPKAIPHKITALSGLIESLKMIGGDDPVRFTHVVLILRSASDVIDFMDQIFSSRAHSSTSIIIISDTVQKREIMKDAPNHDFEKLVEGRRLRFIYKPLKPSKFAVIFDPQKEREMSTDRNQDSAQQVAANQKQVFADLRRRLGGKGHKVLLVEDNFINQTVVLKFLSKVNVESETVLDGVQCTDAVFTKPPGYYSIILCDLHMPNKDGYQACKDIRRWEKKNKYPHIPIIALSANVLGDVYVKCVEAGFNSYVTKPVEFKELSSVLTKFLDPEDPTIPHEFMPPKKS